MIEKIKNHLLNGVLLLLLFSSCKKEVYLEIQQDNQANFK
jgi:type III secretory pathway lipoprotein EscJ